MYLCHLLDLTVSSDRIMDILIHMQMLIGLISSPIQVLWENAVNFDLKEKKN